MRQLHASRPRRRADSVIPDNDLPMVPDSQIDFDPELRFYYEGVPFTGITYADEPDGARSEITYKDGYQTGPERSWYSDGALESEAWYYANVPHGPNREYGADGTLISEKRYECGTLVSSRRWDERGELLESFTLRPTAPGFAVLERSRQAAEWPPVPQ